jgi:D-tyrosyl-tRNA(Tyr) deacylase
MRPRNVWVKKMKSENVKKFSAVHVPGNFQRKDRSGGWNERVPENCEAAGILPTGRVSAFCVPE